MGDDTFQPRRRWNGEGRGGFARCPGRSRYEAPLEPLAPLEPRLRCRPQRVGAAALPPLLQLAHKLKDGTAPYQPKAASRCRYLLMKPSPSPSQVWKRRLILSSSPVLEVSVLLLPALLTSATAAAAIMRPAPEEDEEEGERRRRRQGCLGIPSSCKVPRQGSLPAGHPQPAE